MNGSDGVLPVPDTNNSIAPQAPKTTRRRWPYGVIGFLLLLVASIAVVLTNAMIEIPPPTGPAAVGFRTTTLVDPSRVMVVHGRRTARVVTLDIWYPAANTQGRLPEPYQDAALAALLAKYQGIPDVAGSAPSYAFNGAPLQPGKYPVVVFNHGYGSFTKQNFANFQELASHGYLVVSLGHPQESLMARDRRGGVIEFNPSATEYVDFLKSQQHAALTAVALTAALTQQRAARTRAEHHSASLALARQQPFVGLRHLLSNWVLDTRLVIAALAHVPGADPTRVTLMGHSAGGVVALEIAKSPPSGVRGVINLDGPWVSYDDGARELQLPLLAFLSTHNLLEGHDVGMHGTFDAALNAGSQPAYVIEIAGTAHNNFTDLGFVRLLKYISSVLGPADGMAVYRWQNAATLTFLHGLETGALPAQLLAADPALHQRRLPKHITLTHADPQASAAPAQPTAVSSSAR